MLQFLSCNFDLWWKQNAWFQVDYFKAKCMVSSWLFMHRQHDATSNFDKCHYIRCLHAEFAAKQAKAPLSLVTRRKVAQCIALSVISWYHCLDPTNHEISRVHCGKIINKGLSQVWCIQDFFLTAENTGFSFHLSTCQHHFRSVVWEAGIKAGTSNYILH